MENENPAPTRKNSERPIRSAAPSAGSAVKFFSPSVWGTTACYAILGILLSAAWLDWKQGGEQAWKSYWTKVDWKNVWTAIACEGQLIHRTRTYEVEIVDRLGAGDSFAAGLIHGLLDGDLQKGLDYGVAASALKHSIPGDFAWVTREEVESLLKTGNLRIAR